MLGWRWRRSCGDFQFSVPKVCVSNWLSIMIFRSPRSWLKKKWTNTEFKQFGKCIDNGTKGTSISKLFRSCGFVVNWLFSDRLPKYLLLWSHNSSRFTACSSASTWGRVTTAVREIVYKIFRHVFALLTIAGLYINSVLAWIQMSRVQLQPLISFFLFSGLKLSTNFFWKHCATVLQQSDKK